MATAPALFHTQEGIGSSEAGVTGLNIGACTQIPTTAHLEEQQEILTTEPIPQPPTACFHTTLALCLKLYLMSGP